MSFQRSLVLLLLGWVSASAQQPAEAQPAPVTPAPVVPAPAPARPVPAPVTPPPPGVPIPGAAAQPAAGAPGAQPAAARQAVPLGETKIVEDIVEPKLSGNALAGLYRKYTGRRVIVTAGAATAEFSFVQEASPQDPLTYAEAAELLRKAAVLENFVFVQHPQDANLDVLTLATAGLGPNNVDPNVYNENTPLPETDVVITYTMTLSHIKPDQALNIFTQVIGQFGAYGRIAAVPNASAVVITEKASLIKALLELKKTIDVPGSVQSSKFIKVQYADVTEIASTLTELLTAQQSAQQTAGVQRSSPAPQQGGAPAPAGGSSGGGEETPVQVIPEPRTNRIFVMGRPVDIVFVEGLVREFDIPSSEKTFLRRKLHFLTVSEFLPIAGDALTRAFSGTGDSGGASASGGAGGGGGRTQTSSRTGGSSNTGRSSRTSGSSRSSSGFGGSSSGFGGSSSGFGGGSSGFGGGGAGGGAALSDPNVSSAPESMLIGRTLLVADNITNSVVAQGPPSALEIIERLLDQIDVKPDQVMISTVIGQLTHDNNKDYGVGYLFRGQDIKAGGGGGIIPILPIGEDATSASSRFPRIDPSTLGAAGLSAYGTVGDMSIFLKALQQKANFTVLSRPSIFTSNNVRGSISSGERIAIPTNSNSFSNGGASTNIEYQDVVLKLEVIPLVNSDSEITMEVALLNDEQIGTQTITGAGSNGTDLTVPKISTRELLTKVTIPNNDTIVLGGLIVGRDGKDKSGIPILSDIPYLGSLFSNTEDTKTRSELMVFLQPSIVKNSASLSAVQNDMDYRYKVSPEVRNFADGDSGVLPGKEELSQKGKNSGGAAGPANASGTSTVKPTIRPSHKR